MDERQIHLRIKIKNLADEAITIREEAKKTSGMVKWGLNHHRKTIVRQHSRLNLLAYGMLRGVPYKAMERACKESPVFSKVSTIAKKFGGGEEFVARWVFEAKEHLESQGIKPQKNDHWVFVNSGNTDVKGTALQMLA